MNLIFTILIIVLAAICKAAADVMQHHYDHSIFSKFKGVFWTADGSAKYKNGDPLQGRKYPAFLDGFTDAWHVAGNGVFVLMTLLIFFPITHFNFIVVLICAWTLFIQTFNIFYNHVFKLTK